MRDTWGRTPIRVTDLMVTPDFTRLVAVGMYDMPPVQPGSNPPDGGTPPGSGQGQGAGASANKSLSETRIIIYDLHTKQPETCVSRAAHASRRAWDILCEDNVLMSCMGTCRYIRLDGELTSVKISQDSQYALINRASENGPPAVRILFTFVRRWSGTLVHELGRSSHDKKWRANVRVVRTRRRSICSTLPRSR